MRLHCALIGLAAIASCSALLAEDDSCRQFEAEILHQEKLISHYGAADALRGSELEKLRSQLQIGNALALIQINLDLMAQADCELPGRPISERGFSVEATACQKLLIREKVITKSDDYPAECNSENWVGDRALEGEGSGSTD